jgi:alcohol dehydrogenase (NADP+)
MAESPAKAPRLSVPGLKLNNGAEIPCFGLGTWKSGPGEVQRAVVAALDAGYRHIDCASIYGNEGEVGAALKESAVTRAEIFITSKLFNHDHAAADVEVACRLSMEKLGVDYLDLYLIHWPVCLKKGVQLPPGPNDFTDVPIKETWTAMEALVKKGLVRAIGVSNFSIKKMEEILAFAKIKPAVNQVEGHPYLAQPKLKDFCDANGIVVTAYSPLGSPDRPARVFDVSDPILLEDTALKAIAERVGRTPAEVLIRWAVQRGTVVIPKSVTPSRIEQNMRAALKPLPEDAMVELAKMDRHLRLLKGTLWTPEGTTGPFKTVSDLWDE